MSSVLAPVSEFVADLARRDIRIWREGERLRCSGPSHLVTPELRADLAARKADLLEFLAAPQPATKDPLPAAPPIDRDFDGPNVWTAADLQPDAGFVACPDACAAELDVLRAELRARPVPRESLRLEDFDLPACREVMARARCELDHGPGFAVIDRLDLLALSTDEARSIYWLLASMLARPVPLRWDGTLMRDVTDLGKRSPRAVDTTAEMNYHTDNSFGVCPPEYVSLLCLQKAKTGGMSQLVSFPRVHNEMRKRCPELLALLYGPYVFNRQGEHAPDEETTLRRPIFENRAGTLAARMSHFHVRTGHALAGVPLEPEAEAAMEALEATMSAPGMGHEFWFEPGQIQVLDNQRIGHKRTAFRDFSSPARKRRLVRLWLRDAGLPTYDG